MLGSYLHSAPVPSSRYCLEPGGEGFGSLGLISAEGEAVLANSSCGLFLQWLLESAFRQEHSLYPLQRLLQALGLRHLSLCRSPGAH